MEKKRFGSLYINNRPVVPAGRQYDRYKEDPVIEIGGTKPGKEIEWLTVGHLLIATRVLVHSISWEDLDQRGLVVGKEAVIDGKRYKVRIPSIKEWDMAVKACGGEPISALWNFQDGWSWCIEESTLDNRLRYLCSGNNAHSPMTCSAKTRSKPFGWRPVLEPISAGPNDIQAMFGSMVTVAHNSSVVFGMLTGISDYDLVLRRAQFDRKGPDSDDFAKRIKDGTIVVNRDLVDYISQTQDSES